MDKMSVCFAISKEISRWNSFVLANPNGGNIFSSFEYAQQKETGCCKRRFIFVNKLTVTILEKNTPPLGKLWYVPKVPNVTSAKSLFDTLKILEPFAKKRGVLTVRIETELPPIQQPTHAKHGLKEAAPIILNPSSITLDLTPKLEEIPMNLPQKGRHTIHRAERDGVIVEQVASDENCHTMYALLNETVEGQFGVRSNNYYRTFWQRFEKSRYSQLFFASFEGRIVAGAYATVYGTKSTFKDGASIRKITTYGISHFLQWNVIHWAKKRGSLVHDFCGSPPSDELYNNDHPHHSMGLLKTAFSKTVTDYICCYDLVISLVRYKAWSKLGERIYRHSYFKRTNDCYY